MLQLKRLTLPHILGLDPCLIHDVDPLLIGS